MNPIEQLTIEQLVERGLTALMDALGPVETTRFLSLARMERLDSVLRHQQWQSTLQLPTFYDEIFGSRVKV